jgi:hypothetical protein
MITFFKSRVRSVCERDSELSANDFFHDTDIFECTLAALEVNHPCHRQRALHTGIKTPACWRTILIVKQHYTISVSFGGKKHTN